MINRDDCIAMDNRDQISALRDAFDLPEDVIYLDGNSLGAKPKAASIRVQQVVDKEWGKGLIQSWNQAAWFQMPHKLAMQLMDLIGAWPGELVLTDTTSINLFKALAAALRIQAENPACAQRRKILTERGNFPSDIYIAQGLTEWLQRGYQVVQLDGPEQVLQAIDEDTAVVLLTHVNYRTGYQFQMAEVTQLAHQNGALIIWDLAHSAGAVPLDVHGDEADFAVGCTYKYLNGGPGAPAFIWVHGNHLRNFRQPLTGWWGHSSPFQMESDFSPAIGISRALCGTQPIVSLALVECGLDIFARTDMLAIRAKSLALSDLFISLVEQFCGGSGLELITPKEHQHRGSQVCYQHPHGYAIMQALIARHIIGDYREPGVMRFGLTPLYTRFVDVWDAVQALASILAEAAYDPNAEKSTVT